MWVPSAVHGLYWWLVRTTGHVSTVLGVELVDHLSATAGERRQVRDTLQRALSYLAEAGPSFEAAVRAHVRFVAAMPVAADSTSPIVGGVICAFTPAQRNNPQHLALSLYGGAAHLERLARARMVDDVVNDEQMETHVRRAKAALAKQFTNATDWRSEFADVW